MTTTLQVLTPDERAQVHERTLHVLSTIGVRCDSAQARRIFADAGARVDEGAARVHIPPELVEESLRRAPKQFSLGARRSDWSHPLNAGQSTLCIDGEATMFLDHATGGRRPATFDDWRDATRLCDAIDEIGMYWTMLEGGRTDDSMAGWVEFLGHMFGSFSKHVQESIEDPAEAPWLLEALEIVFGSREEVRRRHPFSFTLCPVSPLVIEQGGTDSMLALRGYDIPVSVMPMPLMGATAPGSMLATVLVANCEVLAMLCLMQAAEPGWPFIYAPSMGNMDPRSGRYADAAAHTALCIGVIEMARHYSLPIMGTGPINDSFVPGIQSAYERTFSGMFPALTWPDILVWPGTLGGAMTFSLEQVLLDVEVWRMCRKAHEGIVVSEESWLTDVLERVGPGGNFIGEQSTRRNVRSGEFFHSQLGVRQSVDAWEAAGKPDILDQARTRVDEILAGHEPLPLGDDVERELTKLRRRAAQV